MLGCFLWGSSPFVGALVVSGNSLLPPRHTVAVALSNRDFPPEGVGSKGWTAAVSAQCTYCCLAIILLEVGPLFSHMY